MMNKNLSINHKQQKGFMALFVSIILLVGISLMVIFTSNTVIMEQNISANQVREKQAFENAKLGLDFFTAFINDRDSNDFYAQLADGETSFPFQADENGDDVVDANDKSFCTSEVADPCINIIANFTADVLALSNIDSSDSPILPPIVSVTRNANFITISSVGTSDDRTANRVVEKQMKTISALGTNIKHSLVSHDGVDITGTGEVQNMYSNANIWSGDSVEHSGTGNTYIADESVVICNAEPFVGANSECSGGTQLAPNSTTNRQQATDKSNTGVDILDNDTALGSLVTATDDCTNTFFTNFFAGCPNDISSSADLNYDEEEGSTAITAAYNRVFGVGIPSHEALVWIRDHDDDGISINPNGAYSVFGCTADYNPSSAECEDGGVVEPIILIADGDVRANGSIDVHGLLYIKGDLEILGTFNVYGAVIVEGEVIGGGTFNIYFNPHGLGGSTIHPRTITVSNSNRDWVN